MRCTCLRRQKHPEAHLDTTANTGFPGQGKNLHLTCLRVPEFEIAVIGSAEELGTSVVEANIPHCFAVA